MLSRSFPVFLLCLFITFSATAQCEVNCVTSLQVILAEDGTYQLDPMDVIADTTGNCASLDSLAVTPNELNCGNAGTLTAYELRDLRTDEDLCSGVLEVLDTTAQVVSCRDTVTVYLPDDRSTQNLYQQDFYFFISDNCDRTGVFDYSPRSVSCSDAGGYRPFALRSEDGQDTVCTGVVEVLDTTTVTLECIEELTIDLPTHGFGALVFPPRVVKDYTDNCTSLSNYLVFPTILRCDDVGENTYRLIDQNTFEIVCSGTLTVRDPVSPEVSCRDTLSVYLSAQGEATVANSDLITDFSANCLEVEDLLLSPKSQFDCADGGSRFDYAFSAPGDTAILCTGLIEVIDTFSAQLQCQNDVIVSLPLTDNGFQLNPEVLIDPDSESCLDAQQIRVEPAAVYCYNAGQQITYQLLPEGGGEVLCTGVLSVENASQTVISCRDSVQISLPATGRDYRLSWQDVLLEFSDNCLNVGDLEVLPGALGCNDADNWVDYQIRSRINGDVLCSGKVQAVDDTPLSAVCKDTVVVSIGSSGFPAILFASRILDGVQDNCTRLSDLRVSPAFFFCPDSSATYSLRSRFTGEEICAGTVVVLGEPSPFGNCAPDEVNAASLRGNVPARMAEDRMLIYPNPNSGPELTLVLPIRESVQMDYRILSLTGREASRGRLPYIPGGTTIPLDRLPAGTYFLQAVLPDGQQYTERFVRTRR